MSLDDEFIPVSRPFMWGKEGAYVQEAIGDGWISSRGKFVDSFERTFAETLGVRYAVGVCNGTAAVHLAVTALGIGQGDEVIVPDFCMISPVLALLYRGATPVPVDVDDTWNIDPNLIEEKITDKTKAILVVHNYGHPAEMRSICDIARRHGLFLIEDTAEALGATINGRMAGTFGDIACFSFYANKIITTGEGGMVVTQNLDLYERARWKRDLCFGADEETRFTHKEIGYNYRLTNMQAAVGVAQLEHFADAVRGKIEIAKRYNAALRGIKGLTLPPEAKWSKNVYWVYGVIIEEDFGVQRATLQKRLRERRIETRRFFTPIHQQPIVKTAGVGGSYPESERLARRGLYLPSFIGMGEESILRVAKAIGKIQGEYRRAPA